MSEWVSVKERLPQKAGWLKARRTNGSEEKFYFNPVLTTRFPQGFSQIKGVLSWRQDDVMEWLDEEADSN